MILTGSEITKEVKAGRICIDPFIDNHINPNSYNYRLSKYLKVFDNTIINPDEKCRTKSIIIPDTGYMLKPNKLYLGSTVEKIGSNFFVTSLIGRSSIARLGLFLQVTADLGNLGAAHCWTLELKVVQPLIVYPNMKIGQISFWTVMGNITCNYQNGYNAYSLPQQSKILNINHDPYRKSNIA